MNHDRANRYWIRAKSPIGDLVLVANARGLAGLYVADQKRTPRVDDEWVNDRAPFEEVLGQLGEYFAGTRTNFDVPLAPIGTEFQIQVWEALSRIPWGVTTTYGALAASLGKPTASRAVGAANGRNPISIIVPCHRVIGSTGALVGYAWGQQRKEWLLRHERALL